MDVLRDHFKSHLLLFRISFALTFRPELLTATLNRALVQGTEVSLCRCSQNHIRAVSRPADVAVGARVTSRWCDTTGRRQVRDSWGRRERQREQLIPAQPAWSRQRWLRAARGPWGNPRRTLSASPALCSIWRDLPPSPEGLSLLLCLFLFQVCVFTLLSVTQQTPRRRFVTCDMGPRSLHLFFFYFLMFHFHEPKIHREKTVESTLW